MEGHVTLEGGRFTRVGENGMKGRGRGRFNKGGGGLIFDHQRAGCFCRSCAETECRVDFDSHVQALKSRVASENMMKHWPLGGHDRRYGVHAGKRFTESTDLQHRACQSRRRRR